MSLVRNDVRELSGRWRHQWSIIDGIKNSLAPEALNQRHLYVELGVDDLNMNLGTKALKSLLHFPYKLLYILSFHLHHKLTDDAAAGCHYILFPLC